MKKIISLLLSISILFSVFSIGATGVAIIIGNDAEIEADHEHQYETVSTEQVTVTATPTLCAVQTSTTQVCSICGDTLVSTTKASHKNQQTGTIPATCSESAKRIIKCSVCGYEQSADLSSQPPTGNHTWNAGEVTVAPTETSEGEKVFTCTVCGAKKTEAIPSLSSGPESPDYKLGDVNGDDYITAEDARMVLRRAVDDESFSVDSVQFLAADVNRDGKVTAADARILLRLAVQLENISAYESLPLPETYFDSISALPSIVNDSDSVFELICDGDIEDDLISVTLVAKNCVGLKAADLMIEYDADALTLMSAINGDDIERINEAGNTVFYLNNSTIPGTVISSFCFLDRIYDKTDFESLDVDINPEEIKIIEYVFKLNDGVDSFDELTFSVNLKTVDGIIASGSRCTICNPNYSYADIYAGETVKVNISSGKLTYLRFVPERSGNYTFASNTDSTIVYLFDSKMEELAYDEGIEGDASRLSYYFEAGEIYYFGVGYTTFSSGYFGVELKSDDPEPFDPYSGKCGLNLTWTLDDDGTLIISGTGEMYRYSWSSSPFYSNDYIKKVVIEEGVSNIGDFAFIYCDNLAEITIPDSVESIGERAFSGCQALKEIIIPSGVKDIGKNAFEYCYSLEKLTLSEGVESIGDFAFAESYALKSVNIPSSVTSIGRYVFSSCSSIESITVSDDNPVYHSYCNCLIETETKRLIKGCNNSVIPSDGSVTVIEYSAFRDCSALTSVTIPECVTSIRDSAFSGCSSISSISIPDGVTRIGSGAFSGCSSLSSVSIPDGLTHIESWTFEGCSSIKSINIPASVTKIGSDAFAYCGSLETITVESDNPVYHSNGNCLIETETKILILGCRNSVIPSDGSVEVICADAFEGCSLLTSIAIPESVTEIGYGAFRGCSSLVSIIIPNSVTSIGYWTFSECTNLSSVTIPNSVTEIGYGAFENCSSLSSIIIPEVVTKISDCTFSGCTNLSSVTIPNSVTEIGFEAFEDCSSLVSIVIPEGVTSIGTQAFYECSNLSDVYIPNSVTEIGHGAFMDCTSLDSILIPESVTSICDYAFSGCANLSSVSIPNSVTEIGDGVFMNCASLLSITISESVTSIGELAFRGCSSLASIEITDGVTSIGSWAFEDCSSLASIKIPDSVISIGSWAFDDCSSLAWVRIPVNITEINIGTFDECSSLIDVYYGGTEEDWEQIDIGWYNSDLTNADIHFGEEYRDVIGIEINTLPEKTVYKHGQRFVQDGLSVTVFYTDGTSSVKTRGFDVEGFYSSQIGSCTVTVSFRGFSASFDVEIIENTYDIITCGNGLNVYVSDGELSYIKFVPEVSGFYVLSSLSDSDTIAYLYDSNMEELSSNDDGGEGYNFKLLYYLEAGREYYFGVRFYNSESSGPIYVELSENEFESISSGETKSIYITTEEYTYLKFVPATSGFYSFSSISNEDTYVYLYDSAMDNLAWDDNKGDNYNFDLTYYFEANKVYVFGVGYAYYADMVSDTISVRLEAKGSVVTGECGEDLTWTLDKNGTLTISGTGDMVDYLYSLWDYDPEIGGDTSPFYCNTFIRKVVIGAGVTSIGECVFLGCSNLEQIDIPDSVTCITRYAFEDCGNLTSVNYRGTEESWNGIVIDEENDCLLTADIQFRGSADTLGVGDINGDGSVNAQDRLILSRYLAKWDGYEEQIVNMDAADINRDGSVNAQDRLILSRYLAKWDGYDRYFAG